MHLPKGGGLIIRQRRFGALLFGRFLPKLGGAFGRRHFFSWPLGSQQHSSSGICLSPNAWARVAVEAYRGFGADRIVAEANFGGAMVEINICTVESYVPVKMAHASCGEAIPAEPIVSIGE